MARGNFVAYYRVSTKRQGESGLGLEAQRAAVKDYLDGGRWSIVAEFTEIESGKSDANRPELAKAFAACRARRATLVIAKLDRLSRDAHFLLGLQKAGVKFVAADMPEANEMVVGIMAVIAQGERRMISQRTQAALQAAKERGKILGGFRGYVPTGEDRMAASAVIKGTAKARAQDLEPIVQELRQAGISSLNALAKALSAQGIPTPRGGSTWTATSVKRVLAHLDDREPARVL
jgi:DNA invertase Pin-like site-specific DNA recombinase